MLGEQERARGTKSSPSGWPLRRNRETFRCTNERVILDINKPPEQRVKGPGGGRADSSRAGLREAPVEATLAWGPGMEEEGP